MKEDEKKEGSILAKGSWLMLNRPLFKKLGIDSAVLLADLISKQTFFKKRNSLTKEGFFFNEKDDIERSTTLSFYRQQKALEILVREKLVETKKHGTPQRVFYRVDNKFINRYILQLCEETDEEDE